MIATPAGYWIILYKLAGMSSALTNPILYGLLNKNFRRSVKKTRKVNKNTCAGNLKFIANCASMKSVE